MRIFLIKLLSIFSATIFICSCSVEKRTYKKGYYISWIKHRSSINVASTKNTNKAQLVIEDKKSDKIASNFIQKEKKIALINNRLLEVSASKDINPTFTKNKEVKLLKTNYYNNFKKKQRLLKKTFKVFPDDGVNKPDDSDALVALVASIAGFLILPLIGSIVGLILAKRALKKIKEDPKKYGGEDLANAARIISIIGIVLSLIIIVLVALILVFVIFL